jgi:hypothetical protein
MTSSSVHACVHTRLPDCRLNTVTRLCCSKPEFTQVWRMNNCSSTSVQVPGSSIDRTLPTLSLPIDNAQYQLLATMSDFTPVNLSQKSTASGSEMREKVQFTHYGFLAVEAWCAYGLPPSIVQANRPMLLGALPYLECVLAEERKTSAKLTGATQLKNATDSIVVYPKPSQRVLRTWPLNCLWIEFFLALDEDDSEATCAEEQLFAFRKSMKWNEAAQLLAGFMAALQLWYFGVPVEQVCDSSQFPSITTALLIVY